jgi:hypothetical protein
MRFQVEMKFSVRLLSVVLAIVCSGFSLAARALDTVETFDPGSVDVEMFAGFHGISGAGRHSEGLNFDLALGYGFIDRFSGYAAAQIGSNAGFTKALGGAGFGIFGTPVDTDHFDMDLMLEFGFGDFGVALTPAVEFNFDLKPDLKLWGMYFRVEEVLTGDIEAASPGLAPYTVLTAGTYWTITPRHKLLAEYDMTVANNPAVGERALDVGSVALGYNLMIRDNLAFVSAVHCDIPQAGEVVTFGASIGIKFSGINRLSNN